MKKYPQWWTSYVKNHCRKHKYHGIIAPPQTIGVIDENTYQEQSPKVLVEPHQNTH